MNVLGYYYWGACLSLIFYYVLMCVRVYMGFLRPFSALQVPILTFFPIFCAQTGEERPCKGVRNGLNAIYTCHFVLFLTLKSAILQKNRKKLQNNLEDSQKPAIFAPAKRKEHGSNQVLNNLATRSLKD